MVTVGTLEKENQTPACFVQQIGTAVPERSLNVEQSAQFLKDGCINPRSAKLLQRIVRLTGIEKRHLAALDFQEDHGKGVLFRVASEQPRGPGMAARTEAFDQAAGPLVLRALRGFSPEVLAQVNTLVTASCTHASSPGLERPILTQTPIPHSADRWNLGFMGCSAGLAGMRLVYQQAALKRKSLVVACELSSLHFQYTDEIDQMTANLLFADGAAAMLLSPNPSGVRVIDCRCVTVPELADQMVWFAGDHGLQLRLSQDLPESLAANLPAAVDRFLQENNLRREDVAHWLVHPGGTQILESVEQCLRLAPDALCWSRGVYRRFGNMSSPTIFFIMKEFFDSGEPGLALATAFGPGLTIELALVSVERNNHSVRSK
ncbi:MAG: 3-oxoacyl-[acyl-carrier-protein] synthase III C-terminal domain-containing protein [Planctomycetota bacterium]